MDPGFDVVLRDAPVPRSGPTDTTTGFVVGPTQRGPVALDEPALSLDEWVQRHGGSVSYSLVPDVVEQFFNEGGTRLYTRRVVGDAAAVDTHSFVDNVAAATFAIDAADPGDSGLSAEIVVDGATFTVIVTDEDDEIVATNAVPFASKEEAVAYFATHKLVRARSLAPNTLPVAAGPTALAGGDDDVESIDNDGTIASINSLSRYLGPGQLMVPAAPAAVRTAALAHCGATNRRFIADGPNDPNPAVLLAAREVHRLDPNARFGAMFGPWDVVPGRFPVTTKVVPPCGRIAGRIARVQATNNDNPNVPAAGDEGTSDIVVDLTQTYTDDEYTELNRGGVNMSRRLYTGSSVQTYGFRTMVDADRDPRWVEFSGSRTIMYVTSQANAKMASFAFDQIDGQGHKFSELEGAITGILLPLYGKDALYGDDAHDAFRVDAGRSVNTPERVRARQLRCVISVRTSPFAEHIVTEIVRRMTTEEV